MTLAIPFSLKTIESLQNGVATYLQATPLISMRTKSLASSQSCRSFDADAWCKRALTLNPKQSFCCDKSTAVTFAPCKQLFKCNCKKTVSHVNTIIDINTMHSGMEVIKRCSLLFESITVAFVVALCEQNLKAISREKKNDNKPNCTIDLALKTWFVT